MSPTARPPLHGWDLTVPEAQALQRELASRVIEGPPLRDASLIAGIDIAIRVDIARAAAIVVSYPDLRPVEQAVHEQPVTFPYIPGLLAFRETPAVLAALAKLSNEPDVIIVDGHGRAHPRRFGYACHVGLWLDKPTIGLAKSRLFGRETEPGPDIGDWTPLMADHDEVIGAVVRTRPGTAPLYVSIGDHIDLESAIHFVVRCLKGYRQPEPTRLAHRAAGGENVVPAGDQPPLFDAL